MTVSSTLPGLVARLLVAAVVLGTVGTAGALLLRRQWRQAPYLAPVYGMLVCGVVGHLAFGAWLLGAAGPFGGRFPDAGRIFGYAVATAAVAVLCVLGPRAWGERKLRAPGRPRGDVLTAGVLLGAAAAFSLALLMLWTPAEHLFALARHRFLTLPIDNELPSTYATALYTHRDLRDSVAGWQSSDRPQLQTGLLLLVDGLVSHGATTSDAVHFATSVLAQLVWVPGAYALVRALGLRPFAAATGVLFAAVSGSLVVNTVFTWPKLLSAGLMLGGLAVLFEVSRRGNRPLGPMVAVGVSVALSLLAHGAGLFALPVVLVALATHRQLRRPGALLVGVAAAGVVYLPWVLYQRFYDPPGDRLLMWHLAGYHQVTSASFLSVLRDAYAHLSWPDLLWNKWANLVHPFSVAPWRGLTWTGVDVRMRVATEFKYVAGAIGLGLVLVAILAVRAAVGAAVRAGTPGRPGRQESAPETTAPVENGVRILLAGCLVSLVVWSLLMFGPGATAVHLGSHVLILVPLVVPVAWLAGRAPRTAVLLLAAQTALSLKTYGPSLGEIHWSLPALATLLAGLVAAAALLALLAGRESRENAVLRLPRPRAAVAADMDDAFFPLSRDRTELIASP